MILYFLLDPKSAGRSLPMSSAMTFFQGKRNEIFTGRFTDLSKVAGVDSRPTLLVFSLVGDNCLH